MIRESVKNDDIFYVELLTLGNFLQWDEFGA